VKNRSCGHRGLITALLALKTVPFFNEITTMVMTPWTDKPIGPTLLEQIVSAAGLCGKSFLKLKKVH